jgi:hypothetical protein
MKRIGKWHDNAHSGRGMFCSAQRRPGFIKHCCLVRADKTGVTKLLQPPSEGHLCGPLDHQIGSVPKGTTLRSKILNDKSLRIPCLFKGDFDIAT